MRTTERADLVVVDLLLQRPDAGERGLAGAKA
jgi:hypothetical protein